MHKSQNTPVGKNAWCEIQAENYEIQVKWLTFIQIHPVALTVIEVEMMCTVRHVTLMPYSSMLHVAVQQNHHR
jgi:hypothetical protein